MLRLPKFTFRQPRTLAEAVAILAGEGAAGGAAVRAVAGGTDLWPNLKRRHQRASTVVSLLHVPELRGIAANGDLRLGATTTLTEIVDSAVVRERFPALWQAVASISAPALRNMGTIGGNVCLDTRCTYYNQNEEWRRAIGYCMKEQGTVCWVAPGSPRCWAISASDSAPILCALGARVRLVSSTGEREVPIEALYRDDGIAYLAKRPEELVAEIVVPGDSDAAHCRMGFEKLRRRAAIDFAVADVAAVVRSDRSGIVHEAHIHLGAVASFPAAVPAAAAALVGARLSPETIAAAARLARQAATPLDNTDYQVAWRGAMVEQMTARVLARLAS